MLGEVSITTQVEGRSTYEVFDTLKQLYEDPSSLFFCQLLLHNDAVEQFSFGRKLKYQVNAVFLVESIL